MELLLDTSNMLKILGGALLVIGLLGGGFEVMAAKLPALTSVNRMIVVVGGTLLLTTGICWDPVQTYMTGSGDQEISQPDDPNE